MVSAPGPDLDPGPILDDIWLWFVKKMIEWALGSFHTLLTWWMADTAYSVRLDGEKGGVLYSMRAHTNSLTVAMASAGWFVAAFRIAFQRKGEPFRAALSQFFELAVIVLILATAVNLANIAGDRYSMWILGGMTPEGDAWIAGWTDGIDKLGGSDAQGGSATATMFILVVFAAAAAISSVVQFALMLFRSGVLIVLVGILPVVAASRFSSYGNYAYKKCIGWLISFILFKPVAATIYATALKLMGTEGAENEADRLFGLALVAGSIFVLPAILRAVMPAVAEDNSSFGIRQIGHFTFGSTAWNAMSRTNHGIRRASRLALGAGQDVRDVGRATPGGLARVLGGGPGGGGGGPGPGGGLGGEGGPGPGGPGGGGGVPTPTGGRDGTGAGSGSGAWWTRGSSGGGQGSAAPSGSRQSGHYPAIYFGHVGFPGGDSASGSPSGFVVPQYRVPDYEAPPPPVNLSRESRPGYTPPSLRDAIHENRGPSGNSRNGRSTGGRYEGPSGAH